MSAPRQWWRTAAVLAVPLLVWWAALYPGGMSVDSFSSWGQVTGGPWSNHHPAPFTALVWLTSWGGVTPATTSLAQVLVIAACLAALVEALRRELAPGRVVLVAATALLVLPLLGPFATVIWKDIPETALLLLLAALLLALPEEGAVPRRRLLLLALVGLGISLLRWNGGPTVVLVGLALLATRSPRRRLVPAAALAVAGLTGFLVLNAIPKVLPVAPVDAVDASAQQLTELAQYAARTPGAFSHQQRAVLDRVAPFGEWRTAGRHGCKTVNNVIFGMIDDKGRQPVAIATMPALKRVWRELVVSRPLSFLRFHGCRSALAWSPVSLTGDPILTVYPMVPPNRFGLHQQAPHWLRSPAVAYADASKHLLVQDLAWRPIGWLALLVGLGVVCHRRDGQWRWLPLLTATPVAVMVSFVLFPAAEDARYTYPAVVLCQLGVAAYAGRLVTQRR